MGIQKIERAGDGIGLRIKVNGASKEITLVDAQVMIVGGPNQKNDPARIAEAMTQLWQLEIDVVYPQNSLDLLDSVRMSDPATERVFWRGSDVVERTNIVAVSYDGEKYVLTQRQTRES